MALTTAGDLIAYCFRATGVAGVGQTPSAEDANDALTTLQAMVAQWQRHRWLVWDLAETVLVATGSASYTIGPAGNFAVARPDRLESAFARFLPSISGTFTDNGGVLTIAAGSTLPTSPTGLPAGAYWNNGGVVCVIAGAVSGLGQNYLDYPLNIIEARETYNNIALKGLGSTPGSVFYDAGWPAGTLYFWPVPPGASYELHIFTKTTLPVLLTLTTTISGFPPEYIEALKYGLMVRLSMDYGLNPKPAHVAAMKVALNTIRMANTQVATLSMPAGVSGRRGSGSAALSSPAFLTGHW